MVNIYAYQYIIGVGDIKSHQWFIGLNWDDLAKKKIKPSYIPKIKDETDLSIF